MILDIFRSSIVFKRSRLLQDQVVLFNANHRLARSGVRSLLVQYCSWLTVRRKHAGNEAQLRSDAYKVA